MSGRHHPDAQEIELCPAIHGALAQLQAGDLAFGLTTAPLRGQSGSDGGKVLAKPLGEGPEIARQRLRQPGCQIVGAVLPDHAPEPLGEVVQGRDLGRDVEQTLQVKPLFGCPMVGPCRSRAARTA